MIVPDTNLLVFAYDSTARHHIAARNWWEQSLAGVEPVGVPWVVVLAFTRLLTHPTICERPVTVAEVEAIVGEWLAQPQVRLLVPTAETLQLFFRLLLQAGAGGNLSTDALIAAQAIEYAGVVCSNDRDFGRFPGLRCHNPLVA